MTRMAKSAEHRLVTYGTLAPGRVNHGQVSDLDGFWSQGIVRGHLIEEGWGADYGCPGITLDPEGTSVEVFIFESADLPEHWDRLDQFEGHEYRRVETTVESNGKRLAAYIYELHPKTR